MTETTSTETSLAELDKAADQCTRIEIVAEFEFDTELHTALILGRGKSKWVDIYTPAHWYKKSVSEAMQSVAASFGTGCTTIKLESISVKASKSPLKAKELRALVVDAYCEACGIRKPSSEELQSKIESAKTATADATIEMLAELRGGDEGIKKFNARKWTRNKRVALEECDLSRCALSGVNLLEISLDRSQLEKLIVHKSGFMSSTLVDANLAFAWFTGCTLSGASFDKSNMIGFTLEQSQVYAPSFKKADLTSSNWRDVHGITSFMQNGIFQDANFQDCSISSIDFTGANLVRARFQDAKFQEGNFRSVEGDEVCFRSCDLKEADFREARLANAVFEHTDLTDADFRGADLTGASLPISNIFERTRFDETTKLPVGFEPPLAMAWKGKGPHPYKLLEFQKNMPTKPIEFPEFMTRIANSVDKPRYKKVLSMLKADRFQLFSKVDSNMVLGVVRSQTDEELVYGCRLAADGSFCCCTQNLNACGGLRGQICKHILVLVIGLVKAEELGPMDADTWTRASMLHKPDLGQDRDAMAELFLQYAGAQAGEIDWRPTETIPEDYYAF